MARENPNICDCLRMEPERRGLSLRPQFVFMAMRATVLRIDQHLGLSEIVFRRVRGDVLDESPGLQFGPIDCLVDLLTRQGGQPCI